MVLFGSVFIEAKLLLHSCLLIVVRLVVIHRAIIHDQPQWLLLCVTWHLVLEIEIVWRSILLFTTFEKHLSRPARGTSWRIFPSSIRSVIYLLLIVVGLIVSEVLLVIMDVCIGLNCLLARSMIMIKGVPHFFQSKLLLTRLFTIRTVLHLRLWRETLKVKLVTLLTLLVWVDAYGCIFDILPSCVSFIWGRCHASIA